MRDNKILAGLCQQFELGSNQITDWKRQILERAVEVFDSGDGAEAVDLTPLHAKIGQLALKNDFLENVLTKAGLLSAKS